MASDDSLKPRLTAENASRMGDIGIATGAVLVDDSIGYDIPKMKSSNSQVCPRSSALLLKIL